MRGDEPQSESLTQGQMIYLGIKVIKVFVRKLTETVAELGNGCTA